MPVVPVMSSAVVEGVSNIIGEYFTGSPIDALLRECGLATPDISTKWRRIHAALNQEQQRASSGTCVVQLIQAAATPARWATNATGFAGLREALNAVLPFAGLTLHSDGQVGTRKVATTLDEAAALSRRMRDEVQRRGGHAEVFKYCSRELVAEDCFGAVFEATKGLAERIREMTGLDLDGYKLIESAFEGDKRRVAFNSLSTDTERNEQRGLANIMKGVFSAFRNPSAHVPKVFWHVSEPDALDLLRTLSLVHRRLDTAVLLPPAP